MKKDGPREAGLAAVHGAGLFVAAAFPLCFVRQPPFQDYAEHVAAAAMAAHPGDYPEYAFNGFLKTNSAFVTFVSFAGRGIGFERAGVLFVVAVLAVNAFVLPRFVLHFGGRGRMRVSSLFALPFVHNWFVSMGMLNFSLGVSLSLVALVALDRQRTAPSAERGLVAAVLLLATWYAHPVPVLVVGLLAILQVASAGGRTQAARDARAIAWPLAPVGLAVLASTSSHLHGTLRAQGSGDATTFQTLPWLVYDLWAHWAYGYTLLSVSSLAIVFFLALFGLGRLRARVPFLGPAAVVILTAAYFAAPYQTVGLGYAGSRIIPYLWMAALLRVPEHLGRGLGRALAACSALYAVGMAIDTVRLAREEDEFAAGTAVVPRATRLDVFDFSPRVTSVNTWSLSTAWGEYVTRSGAHTWEMPGDTPSLPFRWRTPPPPRLETSAHHRFMDAMRTADAFCASRPAGGMDREECGRTWRGEWAAYYRDVDPFVDAILMWDPPPDSLGCVPAAWARTFHRGRLWIFERASGTETHFDVDTPRGPRAGG